MIRLFVESSGFTNTMRTQGIPDEEVRQLQTDILAGRGEVIPGSGGIQKVRWARSGGGKRGGRRVLFADYQELGVTVLLAFYAKNMKENLSQSELADWRRLKEMLDQRMRETYGSQGKDIL